MSHKIALYQAPDGLWYWYILPLNTAFTPMLLADGHEKKIRKAVIEANKKAAKRGLTISYTYMERAHNDGQ
jgi:hypothetical protein